jgi:hypothetical protein
MGAERKLDFTANPVGLQESLQMALQTDTARPAERRLAAPANGESKRKEQSRLGGAPKWAKPQRWAALL